LRPYPDGQSVKIEVGRGQQTAPDTPSLAVGCCKTSILVALGHITFCFTRFEPKSGPLW